MREKVLPVLTVVLGILALWYLAAIPMNVREALTAAERAGAVVEGDPSTVETVVDVWTFQRDVTSRDPNWALVETRSGT